MEIEQFKKLQAEFDQEYFGPYTNNPEDFLFLAAAIAGEAGEFANIVKKYYRKKYWQKEVTDDQDRNYIDSMKKEIIDVFTYFLIIANHLDLDIKQAYLDNLTRNRKIFTNNENIN